ncbi:MAG: DNA-binding protein [Gallionella sp.]|nr:DNA-binding protein [Gallionella sp.]
MMNFDNPQFTKLELVTRPTVTTEEAAHYLNRKPQTLRSWASAQPAGVPRPVRINGRLAWKVSDIKSLLNGEATK